MNYIDLGLPSGTRWADENVEGYYTFDEAVEKYGDNLPTRAQLEELRNNCQWEWIGNGYKVTDPNGNSIVLPAAGFLDCGVFVYGVDSYGFYWSSTPGGSDYAWRLCFCSSGAGMDDSCQRNGLSVRLVK